MPHTIYLQRRLTHRYVGTWQHLDDWEPIGTAKVLAPRVVRQGDDYTDAGAYLLHVQIPAGQDARKSEQALANHFTSLGCSHEWDCCGCVSSYAKVRKLSRRTFSVLVEKSRNY